MTDTNGEIAVRKGGATQVIESDEVDGAIDVDLENQHIAIPPHFNVGYWDPEEDVAADGGDLVETRSSLHGSILSDDLLDVATLGGMIATLAGGYLWGTDFALAGALVAIVGLGLLWLTYHTAFNRYNPNP